MAKEKQEMFWLGAGVVQIGGKEYGADEPLPISKITPATLDRWKASGKVGGKIKARGVGLEAVLENANAKNSELEAQVAELTAERDAANAKNSELEAQVAELTAPAKPHGDK